ncbi:DUF4387 domain-containing protein [Candidimonas nitroreducens]|uniref:Acyl-CoA synthetase n=1 Tax=Candidimonas nitroreducens TaxID=683354 RepID=A0A225MW22_9BURK|nr:DUF4387 domain-containing protein [Candidimonas nitroreducens]OWT64020.1 acyl-CoA synthetase [Candidimonas nitroreducens]
MTGSKPLSSLAKVVRSKNAGPFEVTFDVIFAQRETYEHVRDSGVINETLICRLYKVTPEKIITLGFFDRIQSIKITLPRPRPQGSIGETDMHCCQQHIPLAEVQIPGTPQNQFDTQSPNE